MDRRNKTVFTLALSLALSSSVLPGREARPPVEEQAWVSAADYDSLRGRGLAIPVVGVNARDLVDTFRDVRAGTRRHEALDIAAPAGTPIVAAGDGSVKKLFFSKRGGITVYEFDSTETYCYYYAHLARYSAGLREGEILKRGDPVGYVGASGDAPANAPHLHFAIFKLSRERHWWEGTPINPYRILADGKGQ